MHVGGKRGSCGPVRSVLFQDMGGSSRDGGDMKGGEASPSQTTDKKKGLSYGVHGVEAVDF